MPLNIVKRNSSSPFLLQRSIVEQEEGSYGQGGFNQSETYNEGGISQAIAGMGQIVGAGIASITEGDINSQNISKSGSLEKRKNRLTEKRKSQTSMDKVIKNKRLDDRIQNIDNKKKKIDIKIKEYSEFTKPTLKSSMKNEE